MNRIPEKCVVFVSGLPRSGTTLIQSEIVGFFEVESDPEPWILPHLIGGYKYPTFSVIGSIPAKNYFDDFVVSNHMKLTHKSLLDNYVSGLYRRRLSNTGVSYYIDKTPRNLFFLNELSDFACTKDSLIIQRHPLDIMLSIDEIWGGWFYSFFMLKYDFEEGLKVILNADKVHKILRYEDYVSSFDREDLLRNLLDLPGRISPSLPKVSGKTKAGDPNFNKKYKRISTASVYRYKTEEVSLFQAMVYRSFLRRNCIKEYIIRFYPETRNDTVKFSIKKGLGFKYLAGFIVSVIAQHVPIKVLRHNIKSGFMYR